MENTKYESLIQTLWNCALACEHCATACLQEADVTPMAGCIKLDRDCADMCLQAARLLQRESDIALQYLLLCEEICRMCGDECGKHEHDHCQQCAEACRTCAEACHAHHQQITQS
ncbi:four-helix bundle copper-binding protein [Mucilaginibacter robiniae]|uniref:Four-helix bundle copper-binding protein n=1 Tax=Mucilaginibacter robiniae TaxID=2728022 RepID=A0A7L5DZP5_9SPHI|nr:four-helix bundle copper-binding protein [Mucilaginibacter robiniae]QJD96590.1 four-helix bundle copper-binding protein [Mucilaginibacter robiniae]